VLSVTFAGYHPLYRSYPALTYVATYRPDVALPLTEGRAASEHTKVEQERVRSPLAVGWVELVKSLLVNQGNVKPNMTRWGDRD
jgi:hypothetical protein